jgi:hypothetical protein
MKRDPSNVHVEAAHDAEWPAPPVEPQPRDRDPRPPEPTPHADGDR